MNVECQDNKEYEYVFNRGKQPSHSVQECVMYTVSVNYTSKILHC